MKYSPPIWHLLHNVKSMVKISSIFVAFLENLSFTDLAKEVVASLFGIFQNLSFLNIDDLKIQQASLWTENALL